MKVYAIGELSRSDSLAHDLSATPGATPHVVHDETCCLAPGFEVREKEQEVVDGDTAIGGRWVGPVVVEIG